MWAAHRKHAVLRHDRTKPECVCVCVHNYIYICTLNLNVCVHNYMHTKPECVCVHNYMHMCAASTQQSRHLPGGDILGIGSPRRPALLFYHR